MSQTPDYYSVEDVCPQPSMTTATSPAIDLNRQMCLEVRRLFINAFDIGLIGGILGWFYGRNTGIAMFCFFAIGGAMWAYFLGMPVTVSQTRRRNRLRIAGCLIAALMVVCWSPMVQDGFRSLFVVGR